MKLTEEQMDAIALARCSNKLTTRPSPRGMEDQLHTAIPVLDHGFVRVVDYMGDDTAIVQAARVSYGDGTKHTQTDEGLIRYLMRHWHSTPFEMCEIKLHVKLPIFVARQWIRHRTANVNEYSARYSILNGEFYIPKIEHMAAQSTDNKQGRGETLDPSTAAVVQDCLSYDCERAYVSYLEMIDPAGDFGLARELARMNLPANIYTEWYWKVDLHNLFHFLRLRADPHAQYEIRVYAEEICKLVQVWVPLAYKAFEDYRLKAVSFSKQEMELLASLLSETSLQEFIEKREDTFGLSAGEVREFLKKMPV